MIIIVDWKAYTSSSAIQIIGKWKKQKVYWVQLPKISCFSPQIRFFAGVSKQNGQTFDDVTKCHGLEVYRGIGKCISFNLELFWPYGSIWNYENCALKVPWYQAKIAILLLHWVIDRCIYMQHVIYTCISTTSSLWLDSYDSISVKKSCPVRESNPRLAEL